MSIVDAVGVIVISKSGHDKGKPYVIVSVVGDKHVLLANGENRQVAQPKRKNIRHLDITGNRTAATSDPEIKKAIKEFQKRSKV